MKTTDLTLDLQAYVDGELDASRKADVERALQSDVEAQQLVAGLRELGRLVRETEPVHPLPVSKEFYWSQIQRRIETAERQQATAARPARSALHWLRQQ